MKNIKKIFILGILLLFNTQCLIWRTHNIPYSRNIIIPKSQKIKITVSIDGCFPDDFSSCKHSIANFNDLNKEFAKSDLVEAIYGNSNGLTNSDYHISLYWDDSIKHDQRNILNLVTLLTIGIVPAYFKHDIELIAIVKKTDGTIIQTFEYKESISEIIQILLIFNLPFENVREKEDLKEGMLKLLLKDIISLKNTKT
ncbi:hypothetical protein [Leptospira mtsangambouensis]|uniref:hypothetical protein n=1 Tax=Leptospira mtsangambouensis TaxID=2484912 RepID=UPI001EEA5763|nr:hypothetical protein [Leptospira mtsangambouensis]MCG6142813.1 hypothetical protein [Leptospira mtsangambouensis]